MVETVTGYWLEVENVVVVTMFVTMFVTKCVFMEWLCMFVYVCVN